MESSEFYTAEEVEKLKRKVTAYKNLLTTLKLGDSLEDYQFIQNEFEELKMQMSHIDALREDQDEVQPEQIEEYENQNEVKQVSLQLTSLNQMVEEVLSTLNKIVIGEVKKQQVNETPFPPVHEPMQPAKRVNNVISQPSYSQLRSLAGQIIYHKKAEEPIEPKQKEDYLLYPHEQQRHFNHRYFQSTHTQPNNIYNGLYKNMQGKSLTPMHNPIPKRRNNNDNGFRNELVAPTILPNYYGNQNINALISNDMENTHVEKLNGMIRQPSAVAVIPKQAEQLPVSATTLQIIEQPPFSITISEPDHSPAIPIDPPQPAAVPQLEEDQPPVAIATPQPEDQSPVAIATPQPEDEPPVAIATSQPEDEPPVAIATPQPEDEPLVVIATPQLEDEPPVAIATPQPEDEPPVATVAPQPEEQLLVTVAPSQPEDEPPVAVVAPQPEEQLLVEVTAPQLEEQPTIPPLVEQPSTSAVAFEQAEQQNESVTPSEENHASEGEKKKQKGNSFFSFFRK